ncbi:MAG: 16S rRNA (adenine1518-N6/adenine1519-N6)-dimethyltransferase [Planctomycetota bacterium]|jgi:16S rRNA (adenine1518-N6/adenine1519-N6)-dimethyltransferase
MQVPETPSQLRTLLNSRGLSPNKRYGQNFLVEPKILDVIVRLSELERTDFVLEIGTGAGTLTRRLANDAGFVVTVEIDSGLFSLVRDLLGVEENIRLVHGDIMETKSSLNTEVCEKVDVALVAPDLSHFKVIANLPYNISTPFLSSLLIRYGAPELMVLMVQKELAVGLAAKPGTKDYSPLSILVQLLATVSIDRTLSSEVFWPKPTVESAIVCIKTKNVDPPKVLRAYPLVKFLFSERRKTIRSILRKLPAVMGGPIKPEVLDATLEKLGLSGQERAEALEPEIFVTLDRALTEAVGEV